MQNTRETIRDNFTNHVHFFGISIVTEAASLSSLVIDADDAENVRVIIPPRRDMNDIRAR